MSEKVELSEKILAVDQGIRELWDALDDTQRKSLKNEFFILNRFISSVSSPKNYYQKGVRPNREQQEHYVLTVNEYFNKHWSTLQKHPKLLWLLLCMCGHESKQVFYHEWIAHKKKTANDKVSKFLTEIYPDKRFDEIEVLAAITSPAEAKELAKSYGYDDKQIKKLF